MELRLFRTLWGLSGESGRLAAEARQAGFEGLEGAAPADRDARLALGRALAAEGLEYIAEICTAGSYVPERHATVRDHLESLERGLEHSLELGPRFVTTLAGCDAWPEEMQVEFLGRVLEIAGRSGIVISVETHRSRSLFNPWTTARILAQLPALWLTCDFSHWCVVCERLLDEEVEVLDAVAAQAHHVHARVGYPQGPQVPHPAAPEYADCLAAHQRWWEMIWRDQRNAGWTTTTMTPEFGPDGYLHRLPFTGEPVADLGELNRWMAATERRHFAEWRRRADAASAPGR